MSKCWLKLWSRDDLTSLVQTIANEIDRARLRFHPADPPSRRLRSDYRGATADGRQVWAQPTQGRERRPEYCTVLYCRLCCVGRWVVLVVLVELCRGVLVVVVVVVQMDVLVGAGKSQRSTRGR